MPSIQDWRERITRVIIDERNAVPGRSGETPLTDLADVVAKLGIRDEERMAVVGAVSVLISNPEADLVELDPEGYWNALSFLVRYLPGPEKQDLRSVFLSKLFDEDMRSSRLSVFALHGFIAAGGRMTPAQLNRLIEIKEHAPIAWLGAAAMSSLFQLAREKALEMLKTGQLDVNAFILGMDSWRMRWDREQDFHRLMIEFRNAALSQEQKGKFDRWLERRGFQAPLFIEVNEPAGQSERKFMEEIRGFANDAANDPTVWTIQDRDNPRGRINRLGAR